MTKPLPFTWPFALVFWAVYVWVFIPEFRVIRKATSGAPVPQEDRGSLQVIMIGFTAAIFFAFVLSFVFRRAALPVPIAWFVAGIVAMTCGTLLRRHCFRVLGAFFTGAVTVQSDHRVIDTGAYRWVRHPSYSAALLIVLGIALALGNWASIAVATCIAFFTYSYRAHVEEKVLLASLGAPYAEFMASRKRFVPFVY